MADFARALATVLAHEGGWVHDALDPGGETIFGITRRDHPSWPGWAKLDAARAGVDPVPPNDPQWRTLLADDVQALYAARYWDPLHGDALPDDALATELFDTAVNMGVGTATLLLQQALNALSRNGAAWPRLEEDAGFGPRTLAAVQACLARREGALLVQLLNHLQGARYVALVRANPTLSRFLRGWLQRT